MKCGKKVIFFTALFAVATLASSSPNSGHRGEQGGTITGKVGARKTDGTFLSVQSAKVYVIFANPKVNGAFTHNANASTAGGQYQNARNNSLNAVLKDIKNLEKNKSISPQQKADRLSGYSLQSVDTGLATTEDWIKKHPKESWQMRVVSSGSEGQWKCDDLPVGGYEIVVRGAIAGHDSDWEAAVDLDSGQSVSLSLDNPRFIRVLDK